MSNIKKCILSLVFLLSASVAMADELKCPSDYHAVVEATRNTESQHLFDYPGATQWKLGVPKLPDPGAWQMTKAYFDSQNRSVTIICYTKSTVTDPYGDPHIQGLLWGPFKGCSFYKPLGKSSGSRLLGMEFMRENTWIEGPADAVLTCER